MKNAFAIVLFSSLRVIRFHTLDELKNAIVRFPNSSAHLMAFRWLEEEQMWAELEVREL